MPYFVVLVGCMLVCTLGMGAMMWLMMRGMGSGNQQITGPMATDALPASVTSISHASDGRDAEVAELRAQVQELELRSRALRSELPAPQSASSTTGDVREGELAR